MTVSHDGTGDLSALLSVVSSWLHEHRDDDRRQAVLRAYGSLLGGLLPANPLYNQPTHVLSDLVSLKEVAEIAGVTAACACNWRKRYADFPQDLSGRNNRPLFDRGQVEAWIIKHNQNPRTRRYKS